MTTHNKQCTKPENKFKVKMTSIVTDNAAKSSVICYDCSDHILNLSAGDFTNTLQSNN